MEKGNHDSNATLRMITDIMKLLIKFLRPLFHQIILSFQRSGLFVSSRRRASS